MKDGIDTSTTMGRFLFHIFGAMAEMEREVINERVVSGVAALKHEDVKAVERKLIRHNRLQV